MNLYVVETIALIELIRVMIYILFLYIHNCIDIHCRTICASIKLTTTAVQ